MAKLFVLILIFYEFFSWIYQGIRNFYQRRKFAELKSEMDKKIGYCNRCGQKKYLHHFDGRAYCVHCYLNVRKEKRESEHLR